jgi:hypothetical protein
MPDTKTQGAVTLNRAQELYVIPEGGGYSCLGFDVLIERYTRLAAELGGAHTTFRPELRGTLAAYEAYQQLLTAARASGRRFMCELSPQLIGLEGRRVEVVTLADERRRFRVGKSAGWLPIHLELANVRSSGGGAADRKYQAVRVIR